MAYYKYTCKDCSNQWSGKKVGTRCPKCKSIKFIRNVDNDRYSMLDKAAERYAKKEEIKNT